MTHTGAFAPARQAARPDFPPHDVPKAEVPAKLAALFRPLGSWLWHDPQPSENGWHIACPSCLDGRCLLRPDPDDRSGYLLRPQTCTRDCSPYDVVRWFAVREGDMTLWTNWLERQRARDEKRRARP
jgi:hypothetical protein